METKMDSLSLLLHLLLLFLHLLLLLFFLSLPTLPQAQAGEGGGGGLQEAAWRAHSELRGKEVPGLRGRTQKFLKIFTGSFPNNGGKI